MDDAPVVSRMCWSSMVVWRLLCFLDRCDPPEGFRRSRQRRRCVPELYRFAAAGARDGLDSGT